MVGFPVKQTTEAAVTRGVRSALIGIALNAVLATMKAVAGVLGSSYALIADATESATDIFSSLIVVFGLRIAGKPADENHPYGHGKFEPLAAVMVSVMLLGAAILIAVESVHRIVTPHHAPAAFTLIILIVAIVTKEALFRFVSNVASEVKSTAVETDAWHHRSDAITSAAAFIGISIAIIGGPGYESADDFAALVASGIIAFNAISLLKPAIFELTDQAPDPAIAKKVRAVAGEVTGVLGTHNCNVRKLGFDFFVDLDILCEPSLTIREGHDIAHNVGRVVQAKLPNITKVLVHVEPVDDYGRRSHES